MRHSKAIWLSVALVAVFAGAVAAQSAKDGAPGDAGVVPLAAKDGGPRRWRVTAPTGATLHTRPDRAADAAAEAAPGAVLSNMGCDTHGSEVWCDVRPFRGGPRGYAERQALAPAPGPDGAVPFGPNTSATRAAKRAFDAETQVACAQEAGQTLGQCAAGVARADGGDATVAVTFPNGFRRMLYFLQGEFVSASTTMSGNGRDIDWLRFDGMFVIRVDDQRYEFPESLVYPH